MKTHGEARIEHIIAEMNGGKNLEEKGEETENFQKHERYFQKLNFLDFN